VEGCGKAAAASLAAGKLRQFAAGYRANFAAGLQQPVSRAAVSRSA